MDLAVEKPMPEIVSTETVGHAVYYSVQVRTSSGGYREVSRRYQDFCDLDKKLAASGRFSRTALPRKELMGLRRWLDPDAFVKQRSERLQKYLDHIVQQEEDMDLFKMDPWKTIRDEGAINNADFRDFLK